jgi:NarL family two-component system response regulator LiaR
MSRLLIVEDNVEFRRVAKDFIRSQNFDVDIYEAANAETGFNQALNVRPEVILMDIDLPQISGLELARQIYETLPRCQIIVLTTFDTVQGQIPWLRKDFVRAFIGKNDFFEEVIPFLRKWLKPKVVVGRNE